MLGYYWLGGEGNAVALRRFLFTSWVFPAVQTTRSRKSQFQKQNKKNNTKKQEERSAGWRRNEKTRAVLATARTTATETLPKGAARASGFWRRCRHGGWGWKRRRVFASLDGAGVAVARRTRRARSVDHFCAALVAAACGRSVQLVKESSSSAAICRSGCLRDAPIVQRIEQSLATRRSAPGARQPSQFVVVGHCSDDGLIKDFLEITLGQSRWFDVRPRPQTVGKSNRFQLTDRFLTVARQLNQHLSAHGNDKENNNSQNYNHQVEKRPIHPYIHPSIHPSILILSISDLYCALNRIALHCTATAPQRWKGDARMLTSIIFASVGSYTLITYSFL